MAVAATLYGPPVGSGGADLTMSSGKVIALDSTISTANLPLQIVGDANTGIGRSSDGADSLSIVTGGTELVRFNTAAAASGITFAGNVVISGKVLKIDSSNSTTAVALQISGDPNTGLGQIGGADTVSLVAGGTEMRFSAAGIITSTATAPEVDLNSSATSGAPNFQVNNSGNTARGLFGSYGSTATGTTFGINNQTIVRLVSFAGTAPLLIGTTVNSDIVVGANDVECARVKATGDVVIGNGNTAATVLLTTATAGFLRLPTCAGAPTGAAVNGSLVLDTSTGSGKLWARVGGAWVGILVV